MQSNPTHSCMKPQEIIEKLAVKTNSYYGYQSKQQANLPKLTERDFININQSLKKIDKVYSAYLSDLDNMKKMSQSKPVVDFSHSSKQYQSMYDFYNVYSKHQRQLGKIINKYNGKNSSNYWKTLQDAVTILINLQNKTNSLQSKYSKKIEAETQKLGYKVNKDLGFWMQLQKMLDFYMDQEPKLIKLLDSLKSQNKNQYDKLIKYQGYKSTVQKYEPYLTEMQQLYPLVNQYKNYFLPSHYFNSKQDCASVLLRKVMNCTKQRINKQAQAIYKHLGYKQNKEIENLDIFFKLHSNYLSSKEYQLQQIVKDKQAYKQQPRKTDQDYVWLYNYNERCYDNLNSMQKQTFQKCSLYLELYKEKKDYTFEEKMVNIVFDKIRYYLNIPKQQYPNTLQYLEQIHQQFHKRQKQTMTGSLCSDVGAGFKQNPFVKQEQYNKIKQENQQIKEQLQKYKDKDSNYHQTSKKCNELVNTHQQKFKTIKADYDKIVSKLGVPYASINDIIRKIDSQTLIINEHRQAKQFIFNLVRQIMEENKITEQQTKSQKTGCPPNEVSPQKCSRFQAQPLNLKQNKPFIENWIQNKSYQISDPSQIITDPKSKQFILQTLNQQTKKSIKGFQLLYRRQLYQEQSRSLQQAILGKTNTLLLLKIKQQKTLEPSEIGFFASTSYCGAVQSFNKMSMIMSTKQRKVIKPFNDKIPIHELEEGNIIIGQNDIKIWANMKMTSNHGKSHAFRMEHQNKFQLFGDDQPEYTLECIEVYKVRFYQEKDRLIVEGQDQSNLQKKESRKQMTEKISELTTREQQLEQKLKTMASEKDKFLEDINSVKQSIKSGSPKINNYDETVKQFESISNKLSKLKEKAKQLKNISATLIETKQKSKQDIKSAIKPLLTDQILNKVNSQVEQLTSKYNKQKQELQSTIYQLQSENNKKPNNQSLHQIAKLTKENDRLQESNERYKKTIKKLKSELKPEEAKNYDEDQMLTPEEANKLRQQLNQAKQKFEKKAQEQLKQARIAQIGVMKQLDQKTALIEELQIKLAKSQLQSKQVFFEKVREYMGPIKCGHLSYDSIIQLLKSMKKNIEQLKQRAKNTAKLEEKVKQLKTITNQLTKYLDAEKKQQEIDYNLQQWQQMRQSHVLELESLKAEFTQQRQQLHAKIKQLESSLKNQKPKECPINQLASLLSSINFAETNESSHAIFASLNDLVTNKFLKQLNQAKADKEEIMKELKMKTALVEQLQRRVSAFTKQQLKNEQVRIKDQQQQITKHQQLIQGLKQQISQYQRGIQEYKTKIKKCESSLEKKQEEIEGLNRQYDNVMDEKEELQQKINNLRARETQRQKSSAPKMTPQPSRQVEELKMKIQIQERLIKELNTLKKAPEDVSSSFNCKIQVSYEQKLAITDQLLKQYSGNQEKTNYTIARTQPLFFYPQMREINFHRQVDNKENILVIIKLKDTDHILVAYSQPMLTKQALAGSARFGNFLAVFPNKDPLQNNKIFFLNKKNPQARALLYNDYYLIIGNSQVRIKRGENKIESQIPISFQYFQTEGQSNPSFMFGTKNRQTEVERYDIYRVYMKPT